MNLEDLTPADLEMPAKFSNFRQVQLQMAEFALYGPTGDPADVRRFMCMGAPPGAGKSLVKHMIGTLSGEKYVSLTATRSLEDQEFNDGFDIINIRGRSNYQCLDDDAAEDWTCEDGDKNDCSYYGTENCTYGHIVGWAKRHKKGLLSNYQYWMNARVNRAALEEDGGGNPIGVMLCDEADLIPSELARYIGVWVSNSDLRHYADDEVRDVLGKTKGAEWGKVGDGWLNALGAALGRVATALAEIADQYPTAQVAMRKDAGYRKLDRVKGNLERIVRLGGDNNWIWQYQGGGIAFDCIWPAKYAEWFLWSGVPRIILKSATLRPKSLDMSGIARDKRWFKEWPRIFPPHLSPVVYVETDRQRAGLDPLCKMGRKATDEQKAQCVKLLDEMAGLWQGRNGIVQTPSYPLAEWLFERSRWAKRMVLSKRGPGEAVKAAEKYRKTPGAILVSPSFSTGWNFPDQSCEWQFIPKLPFPDRSDPVVLARCEDDEMYYNAETGRSLVQRCGRGTRHEEDECTTVIADSAVKNFRHYAKETMPGWFRVMDRKTVPGPRHLT